MFSIASSTFLSSMSDGLAYFFSANNPFYWLISVIAGLIIAGLILKFFVGLLNPN